MRKKTIVLWILLITVLIAMGGTYYGISTHYKDRFVENIVINGFDASDMTVQEVEQMIADEVEDYDVVITKLGGEQETISGEDFDYHFVSKGEIQGLMDRQNQLDWLPAFIGGKKSYKLNASTEYDAEKLRTVMNSLDCFQDANVTKPQDAYLNRRDDGQYYVEPEVEGNQLDPDKVFALLSETVTGSGTAVDLEAGDCYVKPQVYSDDEFLNTRASILNKYGAMTVTIDFTCGYTETLQGSTIQEWLTLDDNNEPSFDEEQIASYVQLLADAYDTIGCQLPFTTSRGAVVYVESVSYGWQMNQGATAEELMQVLKDGESVTYSPVWYESAAMRGENDLSDTYVEIDYSTQHMWFYKNGQLVTETDVVTGNPNTGHASPMGTFIIFDREANATLKGEIGPDGKPEYETPVKYWLPFWDGAGIHDASWQEGYWGGTSYLTRGSHGCINTPEAIAKIIFDNIDVGTPVVCY